MVTLEKTPTFQQGLGLTPLAAEASLIAAPAQEAPDQYPNPDSGKKIASVILELGGVVEVDPAPPVTEADKQAQLERYKAERYGIIGATVSEYSKTVLKPSSESERPSFTFGDVKPSYAINHNLKTDGPEGPGFYSELAIEDDTELSAFLRGMRDALKEDFKSWMGNELDTSPRIQGWANRFAHVVESSDKLGIPEFIDTSGTMGTPESPVSINAGFGSEAYNQDLLGDVIGKDAIANVPIIYGDMADVALRCMDSMDMPEEGRLAILDDIVLQAVNRSLMHLEKFSRQTPPSEAEGDVKLVQRPNGRWELDWDGKTVPKSPNQLTKTQHCPAAYETVEGQSPIKLQGMALNTALAERGFLKPGAASEPVNFVSKYIGPPKSGWDLL